MNPRRDEHPRDLLSAYLDGEVDRDVRTSIERHLSVCDTCRALLEDFRTVAAAAARETPPPVPAHLRQRIRGALDAKSAATRARLAAWFGPYRLGLSAAAAVVLVIGLWALRQGPPASVGFPEPPSSTGESAREQDGESSPRAARTEEPSQAKKQSKMNRSVGDESLEGMAAIPPSKKQKEKSADDSRLRVAQAPAASGTPGAKEGSAPFASAAEGLKNGGMASGDRPAPTAASAPPGPAAPAGVLGSMKDEALRRDAEAPASDEAAVSGRRLLVEYPGYSVSVFEDGTLLLSAKEYSCAVRQARAGPDPDLESLFTLASSGREDTAGGRSDVAGTPRVRLIGSAAAGPRAGNAVAEPVVPPAAASEIQARLRTLLRDRYLALLQARCGPAPQPVREP